MKNLLVAFGCLIASTSFAQQIPNAGFEFWDSVNSGNEDKPTDWNTVNSALGGFGSTINQTCFISTDKHNGAYAILLKTVDPPLSFNPDINGIASTGNIQTTAPYGVTGGVAFTYMPDSLVGYYKYFPSGSDIGTIEMVLKGSSEDTIAHARFETPNQLVNGFTRFAVPFVYRNGNTPVLAANLLSSSDGFNPVVGSQLWVDDLSLVYNPLVGVEDKSVSDNVEVYFSNNQLYIKNPEQEPIDEILIYDLMGRVVKTLQMADLSLSDLPIGFYTYSITGIGKSGKVFVQ